MIRVTLLSVALLAAAANATSFNKYYQRQNDNPFQDIPDLRTLGFCLSECATVSEAQVKQTFGDLSGACTPAFASSVGNCMQCIGNSPFSLLLTDQIRQKIQEAKARYESQCAAAGSPITLDIGSAFAVSSSTANSASASTPAAAATASTTPTSTISSTGSLPPSPSATGAGYAIIPPFGVVAVAAIAVFATI